MLPKESFAALLDESLTVAEGFEGRVIKGTVVAIENDMVIVDVGLKSEGRVPLKEFGVSPHDIKLHPATPSKFSSSASRTETAWSA